MSYSEEFELDDNVTMDEVKHRVKAWQASYMGADYARLVKSERDIVLIKSKQDAKVCCYPCIIAIIAAFLMVFIRVPYYAAMAVVVGYIILIFAAFIISYGYFFLGGKKTEIHLSFSFEMPIHVRMRLDGNAVDSTSDYESLKKNIQGHTKQSGPGVLW